jgi:hypothetical protein
MGSLALLIVVQLEENVVQREENGTRSADDALSDTHRTQAFSILQAAVLIIIMRTDKKHRRAASRNKINGLILIERGVIRGALGCDKGCFSERPKIMADLGEISRSRRSGQDMRTVCLGASPNGRPANIGE